MMMTNAINVLFTLLSFVALLDCSLAEETCKNTTLADVLVIYDSPSSIQDVDFTCYLVQATPMGPDKVQFGFGISSTTYQHYFNLNTHSDANSFCQALSKNGQLKTNTNTAGDIDNLREGRYLFDASKGARENVDKVLILISDGRLDNQSATQKAVGNLRDLGVTIIPVDIGPVDIQELDGISGKPGSTLNTKGFVNIDSILNKLSQRVCEGKPEPTITAKPVPTKPCPQSAPHDVVFCVDASGNIGPANFSKNIEYLKQLTSTFTISETETNVASFTFGTRAYSASNKFLSDPVQVYQSLDKLAYTGSSTGTNLCIDKAIALLAKGRIEAEKDLVVFIDGKSDNPDRIAQSAAAASNAGVTVYVVAVGTGVDNEELFAIASDPRKILKASDYNHLGEVIIQLSDSTCASFSEP